MAVLILAILLALAAGGIAFYLVPSPAALWTRQTEESEKPRLVRIDFEGSVFQVPDNMIARVKRPTFGPVRKLDLVAPWKSPLSLHQAEELDEWILLQFEPVNGGLSSRERFERIYVHYFSGPPVAAAAGLVQYDFAPASPYADMQLFVDRQASPPVFLHCDLKPSRLGPVLCERRLRVTDRIALRYRFDRSLLERWIEVDREVLKTVNQVLTRRGGV